MTRLACLAAACLLLWAGHLGCTKKTAQAPPRFDPEANSGPDGKRSGAVPIEPNKAYTDNVDYDNSDRSDWRSIELRGELRGKPGELLVELHWDNALTDLNVDVYDSIGVKIAGSPANSGESAKALHVPIEQPGTYFIRVQAPNPMAASDYTLEAKWGGEAVEHAPPPASPKERTRSAMKKSSAPKKHGAGRPEDGVQGRIVQSHREGGSLVLYLDKGSAAGVVAGQNGWILEGPSGVSPLEGGNFTVTQVVDEGRSVARTGLKSINRNTRVSINVGH